MVTPRGRERGHREGAKRSEACVFEPGARRHLAPLPWACSVAFVLPVLVGSPGLCRLGASLFHPQLMDGDCSGERLDKDLHALLEHLGQLLHWVFCLAPSEVQGSGKRSASGRRRRHVGKVGAQCGHVCKAAGRSGSAACAHVHA